MIFMYELGVDGAEIMMGSRSHLDVGKRGSMHGIHV